MISAAGQMLMQHQLLQNALSVDVTNTTTHKVKFNKRCSLGTRSVPGQADPTTDTTAFTFIRLGDT
jgi:hypothetical protein